MTEEILKVQLAELLETIRLKLKGGPIIEVAGADAAADECRKLPDNILSQHERDLLSRFCKALADVTADTFPIKFEFAVKMQK